jgi:hypothetical protein
MVPIREPKSCGDVYIARWWVRAVPCESPPASPLPTCVEIFRRMPPPKCCNVHNVHDRHRCPRLSASLSGIVAQVPMPSGATPRP